MSSRARHGCAEPALLDRHPAEAVRIFNAAERRRFLDGDGRARDPEQVAWELVYRLEPALYESLVAGERVHESVLAWLPVEGRRVLELGAGCGRLTLQLAPRCAELVAVEPAAALRRRLRRRLSAAGHRTVVVHAGFFDAPPVPPRSQDVVISCAAFSPHRDADPEAAIAGMESRCVDGGMVIFVWPDDVPWLLAHGYQHLTFAGPLVIEYRSVADAVRLARIAHPEAAAAVARGNSRFVPYEILGVNPPRDVCWKRCAST